MNQKNNKGFSMVETMVAGALLVALGLGASKMRTMLSDKVGVLKKESVLESLVNDIRYRIRNKKICTAALVDTSATSGTDLTIGGYGTTPIDYQEGMYLDSNLQVVADATDTAGVLEIEALRLGQVNEAAQVAEIEIEIKKRDLRNTNQEAQAGSTYLKRKILFMADIDGGTIANCLDTAELAERSLARTMCNQVCPDTDPECLAYTVDPNDQDSVFFKCQMAVAEAIKEMEKTLCGELGIWNEATGKCDTLHANTTNPCNANTQIMDSIAEDSVVAADNLRAFRPNCVQRPRTPAGYRRN